MYHFAVVALLGLATMKVAEVLEGFVPALTRISGLLRLALGVGVAVAIDYSMFEGFGISVREAWLGTWATGFVIGTLGYAWRAIFAWLGFGEGETSETRSHGRPRMAA
jgi:hypothetical protein